MSLIGRRTLVISLPMIAILVSFAMSLSGSVRVAGAADEPDIHNDVLLTGLADPTAMDIAPDGRVFVIQRDGILKIWHPDGTITTAGQLPTDCAPLCPNAKEQLNDDGGQMGMLLDRNFEQTGRIFFSWTPAGTTTPLGPAGAAADGTSAVEPSLYSLIRVSSFVLKPDGQLDLDSEQIAIEDYAYNTPHSNGAHSFGGDMNWMADGTLLWSPGDATSPRINGYSPQDNRPLFQFNNAMRTAANPKSLWGKIVRMRLDADGKAVPPQDNPGVRDPETFTDWNPFVYSMGYRNPFRFAVEPDTQRLFVGMVGPDAGSDDPNRGPHGVETIHTVEPGGGQDAGWPRCIGNNQPYRQFNELTQTAGEYFDCGSLGVTPATFWYGRGPSPWSAVLDGSCALDPMIYPANPGGARTLPERFWNQLVHIDWSSGKISLIPITPEGTLDTTLPDEEPGIDDTAGPHPSGIAGLLHPIDAVMGPDGALYILNYGSSFWGNTNGSLVRVSAGPAAPAAPVGGGKAARAPKHDAPQVTIERRDALEAVHGPDPMGRVVGVASSRRAGTVALGLVLAVSYALVLFGRRRLRSIV